MRTRSAAAPNRNRDVEFLTFLRHYRAKLVGAAFLIHGDARQAERLVEHAVAIGYGHGERFLTIAAEQLARTEPRGLRLAWEPRARIELIDADAGTGTGTGTGARIGPGPINASVPIVLARLDRLSRESRTALVLCRYLGLSTTGVAELLGLNPAEVDALVSRALLTLSDLGSPGAGGAVTMMESIVPPTGDVETAAFTDLRHGRQLIRRRRARASVVAVAAAVVLLLIGVAVWPDPVTVVQVNAPPPGAASSTPTAAALCTNPKVLTCRVGITRDWRYRMAAIVTDKLDPKGSYFSGYSYGYDARYDSDALWQDKGGALGLDVFNAGKGSTDVFVQIATSRQKAVRCGVLTKQKCIRQQMMDFNFFTMTETSDSRQGVEVQYRPAGTYVVTIVVRDPTKGTPLVVDRGAVLELIQDPRFVLPKI